MRFLRQRLAGILLVWLACQVSALAAPVVLAAAGTSPVEALCTCPGGDHETCPMHHGKPQADTSTGVCGAARSCVPTDVALLSLAGGIGVLPDSAAFPLPSVSSRVTVVAFDLLDVVAPHDTPPPRL